MLLSQTFFKAMNLIPASIYWKDLDGFYLGRNHYAQRIMQKLGFENDANEHSIMNKSDYEFFEKEVADNYRKNDLRVINEGCEITSEEIVILPNGKKLSQLSSKAPLFDNSGKICGVIGNTILMAQPKEFKNSHVISVEFYQQMGLSKRQADCLFLLVKGMTIKQIANTIYLSPKTVEHYLEAVKNKFDCETRSQLIAKAFAFSENRHKNLHRET